MSDSISVFPNSISDLKDSIEKTDDDGVLQVYSYKYCDVDSTEELKNCRGLVFNGDTLLFKSLGFTPEYNETQTEFLTSQPITNYTFFPSEEGTLIRLFYYNKWYVTTHRKLNAFNSRWGSEKSFGDIFVDYIKKYNWESLESFTDSLNKEHTYLFLIRNTVQNKIVSNPSEVNSVFFVGSILNGTGDFTFECSHNLNIPHQLNQLTSFNTWEDVFNYVKQVNPLEKQGIIAFWKDQNGVTKQLKLINTQYQLYSRVRGNEPNIIYRYLQVRNNPIYSKIIYELYPEHNVSFLGFENMITQIARNIHSSYILRFVNKNYVVVPKEEYRIITDCHGWHISNRNNKVTLDHVINVLNQEKHTLTLYLIIKRYLQSSNASNTVSKETSDTESS